MKIWLCVQGFIWRFGGSVITGKVENMEWDTGFKTPTVPFIKAKAFFGIKF